ncbi:MAG TPA: hypothetical protein VFW29_05935 [Solirubrobacteraceae bacterium]|nr:hypothetical protein [Solirubrobacteraceae bacterium]
MRRIALVGLAATTLMLMASGTALAAEPAAPSPSQGNLHVTVNVKRFIATSAGTEASGTATATLTPIGQHPITINKPVRLAVSRSTSCSILSLTLEKLELNLLGLNVNLEKVVLNVTGQPHGGVLGSLFCSLAHAKVKAARVAAASRLNTAIHRTGAVRPLSFGLPIRASAAAVGPTCPVLNLVLGPLHLDLLGLVVDLNQVHLVITAEPAGGVLGSLFCGLANTKLP